jgi:biotin carboxyl carrier protein
MEMVITTPEAGRVQEIGCLPGRLVQAGQDLVVIERV